MTTESCDPKVHWAFATIKEGRPTIEEAILALPTRVHADRLDALKEAEDHWAEYGGIRPLPWEVKPGSDFTVAIPLPDLCYLIYPVRIS